MCVSSVCLTFKPNSNKTERAFTPNMNSPEVLVNKNLTAERGAALDVLLGMNQKRRGRYNLSIKSGLMEVTGVAGYSGHYNRLGSRNLTDLTVGEIMELQASITTLVCL